MQINLIPQRLDDVFTMARSGDTLIINGQVFDLSEIPDGATLPQAAVDCPWLASDIVRVDGILQLSLILPHGANASDEALFPDPLVITKDGPVILPGQDRLEGSHNV